MDFWVTPLARQDIVRSLKITLRLIIAKGLRIMEITLYVHVYISNYSMELTGYGFGTKRKQNHFFDVQPLAAQICKLP